MNLPPFLLKIVLQTIILYSAQSFRDFPSNRTLSFHVQNQPRTVYEKSFKNLLVRKKRAFVFFKGTVVVLTAVTAKAVIVTSPRGLIQSNEVDIMYDVPLLVDGWRQPFTDYFNKMKGDKKKDNIADGKYKFIGGLNTTVIPADHYYSFKSNPFWVGKYPGSYKNILWPPNRRNFKEIYRRPYYKDSPRYYPNSERRNSIQPRTHNRYYSTNRSYHNASAEYYRQKQFASHDTKEQNTRPKTTTPSWHHHREYRERRSIYEHFEKFGNVLGMKLRKCILRAICEMKEELLPEGQSFINDVARILFTVPTDHDDKDDEFTQMATEENVNCARRFMISCPHSPMEYFLSNFAPKDVRPPKTTTTDDLMKSIIYS